MNYNRFQKMATRLLTKYDARNPKIALTIRQAGSVSDTTGLFVAGATTSHTITGVTINYTDSQIDGEMIKRGDIKCVCTSLVKPRIGDYVTMDGLDWTVVEPIIEYNPGGTVICYEFNMRR